MKNRLRQHVSQGVHDGGGLRDDRGNLVSLCEHWVDFLASCEFNMSPSNDIWLESYDLTAAGNT